MKKLIDIVSKMFTINKGGRKMNKLLITLAILLVFMTGQALGAGTVTQTRSYDTVNRVMVITMDWQGDAVDGSVPVTETAHNIDGYVIMVVTDPGTPAPTDNYDITLTDSNGADIMDGLLANRDTATTEQVVYTRYVAGTVTLNLTNNSVANARGQVKIYVYKER